MLVLLLSSVEIKTYNTSNKLAFPSRATVMIVFEENRIWDVSNSKIIQVTSTTTMGLGWRSG